MLSTFTETIISTLFIALLAILGAALIAAMVRESWRWYCGWFVLTSSTGIVLLVWGSSPVRWCTTSSRDSSWVDQAVKAGVTSSVPSVTLSAGLSVRERASTSRPR